MLLVADLLEQTTQRTPDKVALICGQRRLSYGELDRMANRVAHALIESGVRRGDRVVLLLPNGVEFVASLFAVAKAGAVFVAVNYSTKTDKLQRLARDCRPTALVTTAAKADAADRLLDECPWLQIAVLADDDAATHRRAGRLGFDTIASQFPESRPRRQAIDRDLACLIYTSGSSGTPKGVMSTHGNVMFAVSSVSAYHQNVPDDVIFCALPLSFDYGLYQILMSAHFGGTVVLETSFTFPAAALKLMHQEGVTGFPGVPTMFALLVRMDLGRFDLSRLRYITNTGAALPTAHIRRLRSMLPHVRIFSSYGLTETKRTLFLPPDQIDRRPGSVGIAIPGTEVWLEDDRGRRLGPGETGELVIRGGHVMQGYWEAPEQSAERFRPGPLPGERVCHSGDLFRRDEDGYYYFVGRKDDIFKCRGEKVAPKEIENVLYRLPDVAEAAVVAVPDSLLGHAVKAIVVTLNGHLSEKDVLRHCRANLEDYLIPKYVEFVDELPKSLNGKIQKATLTV